MRGDFYFLSIYLFIFVRWQQPFSRHAVWMQILNLTENINPSYLSLGILNI